ncbi:MAG: methionyl-tRNA formyltransferase [Solobacterium sp.]|nr:methionyl-tRNA formyltransferase [Solobacterium sp.]
MKPRTIFFGTPVFACSVLKALQEEGYPLIAAVSQPDKPVGRKHIPQATPVRAMAESYGIPVLAPEKLKDAKEEIEALAPELIVTCAYGQFIPESILSIPKYGCLNIHPSLLPKYRGGAPVHRAVMNGDTKTGVCLMEMVRKMDAGKVYACIECNIAPDDTTASLNTKLESISARLIQEALPKVLSGELQGSEQDEDAVVIARNIAPEEEQVRFAEEDVKQAYDHIRALFDEPIAYGVVDNTRIKFYEAWKEEADIQEEAGTILPFDKKSMRIACRGGILHVTSLQMQGKKQMPAQAFANGAGRSLVGKRFE